MNHYDDYEDEMRDLRDLRDAEIDRILAGQTMVGEPMSELAAFLKTVPSAFHEAPDEVTERAHLDAIVAAATELKGERVLLPASSPARPTLRRVVVRMKTFTLKLAASAAAAFLALTGLAYAGMDLPGSTVEDAIESVLQVELPNQGSNGKSSSDDVEAAKEAFGDERGCEFGQAVSAAASGKADDPEKQDPCVKGDEGKSDDTEKAKKPKKAKKVKDRTHGKSDTAPNGNANAKGKDPNKVRGKSDDEHGNATGQDPDKVRGKSDQEHGKDKADE